MHVWRQWMDINMNNKEYDKHNCIVWPQFLINKYGSEFYLEFYDDETIKLVPVKKEEK